MQGLSHLDIKHSARIFYMIYIDKKSTMGCADVTLLDSATIFTTYIQLLHGLIEYNLKQLLFDF